MEQLKDGSEAVLRPLLPRVAERVRTLMPAANFADLVQFVAAFAVVGWVGVWEDAAGAARFTLLHDMDLGGFGTSGVDQS
jgi:hypothetical protein